MQRYCTELTEKLLKSLDKEYNVVDMGAVVDVITALEKTAITKEVLEITRLGKYVNELRRKTNNDALAKRAKDLVRRWRVMVLPSAHSTPQPTPADTAPPALNGAKPHSPALRSFKPHSPALKSLKPQSPLLKDAAPFRVISPALSLHSDHSRSPNASSNKQSITQIGNHRMNSNPSPVLGSSSQNHSTEAVPRTHSSNKRLRKDDSKEHTFQHHDSDSNTTDCEPFVKKLRVNGENISGNLNSQVPSPTFTERISENYVESSTDPDDSGPKKRGRKKGSKSVKKQPLLEDRVKEKLASISRNPKLKTTQELLADLQARGSNSSVSPNAPPSQSTEPPSMQDILRSNNDQLSKFLRSTQNNSSHRNTVSDASLQTRLKSENCRDASSKNQEFSSDFERKVDTNIGETGSRQNRDLTVEEILAKLPPLDPSSIHWSDCEETNEDESVDYPPREVTAGDLERLHTQHIEGLNGNFQPKLSSLTSTDSEKPGLGDVVSESNGVNNVYGQIGEEFREWHQMLERPSYDGQTLYILPYVIID